MAPGSREEFRRRWHVDGEWAAPDSAYLAPVLASRCDGVLIALGLNDWLGGPGYSVPASADALAAIAARFAPLPVWIAAPTHVTIGASLFLYAVETRRNQLRSELLTRGLLTGIDPPYLPNAPDGVHLLDGESAALGALWFGVLH